MKRNLWGKQSSAKRAIAFLTAVFMLSFSYAGITVAKGERTLICGLEEHTHTDACYEKKLICGQDETEDTATPSTWSFISTFQTHTHSDQCYDNDGDLVCGIALDAYFHTHNEYCKDQDGNIICGLEEKKPHVHEAACYQTEQVLICTIPIGEGAHEHTDACRRKCNIEEHPAHTDNCYTWSDEVVCGKEDHTHSADSCGLICTNIEEGHVHTDECYNCGKKEHEHTHTDECHKKLICEKELHTHSDICQPIECGLEPNPGHQHGEGCYENKQKLTCTQLTDHKHSGACWDGNGKLTCGQLEVPVFTCTEANRSVTQGQTIEGHKHSDACYQKTDKLICGKEAHTHSDACYKTEKATNNTQTTNNNEQPIVNQNTGGSTTPAGAQTSGQPSNTKVTANSGESSGTTGTTNTASSETARDPNKTYAPDGSEYNPDTGSSDKSSLVAVSGSAKGASFNILDPVKTTEDKTVQNLRTTTGTKVSTTSASSGPAGATSTTSTDKKTTTDGTEGDDKTDGTDAAADDSTYSIAGGYNVMLIGLAENNIQSETWPLLMQRGIVFEDFERGEDAPENTGALLQDGIEGVKQEGADDYWNSPSAAATAGDLINQFGFYGILEQEKQTDDAQMLAKTAERIIGEGLVMNARNIPFFMDVQFTGNGGQGDTLRQLITELENDGLGGNTVLIFTQTGKGANSPLVIVHPAVWENKTITTPMKAADLLATILSLSGQAEASQIEMLATLAGTNVLTTEELAGVTGLVPEPKAEEEVTAEDGVKAEAAGSGEDTSGIAEKLRQNGFGMEGMPEMNLPQGMKTDAGTKKVTTNSTGAGPGSSDAVVDTNSAGPGGPGEADDSASAGPGASETGEVSPAGPGAGAADDSSSAGPGGIGTGEVSSDGPGHP